MCDKDYKLMGIMKAYDRMWKRAKVFADDGEYERAIGMYFAITILEDIFPETYRGLDDNQS